MLKVMDRKIPNLRTFEKENSMPVTYLHKKYFAVSHKANVLTKMYARQGSGPLSKSYVPPVKTKREKFKEVVLDAVFDFGIVGIFLLAGIAIIAIISRGF